MNRERLAAMLVSRRQTVGWSVQITPTMAELLAEWEHQPNPDTAIQIVHELQDMIQPIAEQHAARMVALWIDREKQKQRRIA